MIFGMPTVGVAPGTYTLQLGHATNMIPKPCPSNPEGWHIHDVFTWSPNPDVGYPGDHAVGYYDRGQLGDAEPTAFGTRLDILGVVGGITLGLVAILIAVAKK